MQSPRLFFRRAYRLSRLGLHLLLAVIIAGLLLPNVNRVWGDRLIRYWSRRLLKILGIRVKVEPPPELQGGALLVCNHVSWLDIYLIFVAKRVHFVSKSEVRAWPVAGWLALQGGTLFLERGRRADTARVNDAMRELMQQGAWVGVFPEGTTSDGRGLKRFLPSLLQPAVELGCPIVPAALRYRTASGEYSPVAAYIDDMSIWQSLKRIVSEPRIIAELSFGEPFAPDAHRRELAMHAQSAVAAMLDVIPASATLPNTLTRLDPAGVVAGNPERTPVDPATGSPSAVLPTDSRYPAQSDSGG